MTAVRFLSGSPLHTLYELLVGKTPAPPPAAPPLYTELADWSTTLATVLCNATG